MDLRVFMAAFLFPPPPVRVCVCAREWVCVCAKRDSSQRSTFMEQTANSIQDVDITRFQHNVWER